MKIKLILLLLFLLQFPMNRLTAQSLQNENSGMPLKQDKSVLFGKDIVIHDQPDRNQRNIAICSAFNGWLYAVYSYPDGPLQNISVLKSTDNGINWVLLAEGGIMGAELTTRVDIIACGDSTNNIKLFVGYVYFDTSINVGGAYVEKYNPEPFIPEDELLGDDGGDIRDLVISNDEMYPSNNSNPFSLGVLYSKRGYIGAKDTIIFRSSSNGGISLNNRQVVATTSKFFHKVALSFGRSPSFSGGRYFAAWEEQANRNSTLGHIYTSHSEPNFNSTFTSPKCLDSLDLTAINRVRNPVIACQYNNTDNDSSNISEIVMFEKYLPPYDAFDLKGFYNLQATTSDHFSELSISTSTNNKIEPDICFNPYNSQFMVTYFDSTQKKLPYLTNDVNLTNPNSWNIISQGYNDNDNLISPYPKIKINTGQQDGMNVWNSEGTNGKGIAMFDAVLSNYTGISENNQTEGIKLYGSYPNPCSAFLNIGFELQKAEKITIDLYNIIGNPEKTITNHWYNGGNNIVTTDVSNLSSGTYIYTLEGGDFFISGKFTVLR